MDLDFYTKKAARGSQAARRILKIAAKDDADESDRSDQITALKAKASGHSAAGEHMQAAASHELRGHLHMAGGEHKEAADAYKHALDSFPKVMDGCEGMSSEQIRAIHAHQNA